MRKVLKYLAISLSSIMFSLVGASTAFAQEADVDSTEETPAITTVEEKTDPTDIYEYTIFVHEDCSHCAVVEAFVTNNGIEDKVTYKQLKNNDENMGLLEEYWEELEIEGNYGWPLLVREGGETVYEVGDTPIIVVLAEDFGLDYDAPEDLVSNSTDGDTDEEGVTSGDKIFFYIGGIFVVGIIGYGLYSLFIED
jgi:hypothetical protein